jgi:demethylmenaquinone methyltransferase / 2-methoxy-6-polyprenyl-1,4-benzoquinol methylase
VGAASTGPTAPDGSLHPDRRLPTFERDLRRMFGSIAERYDTFNHLATFGQDLLWRPRALWEVARFQGRPVRDALDVGCGTGALARLLAVRYPDARVVAVDFSRTMVHRAQGLLGARGAGGAPRYGVANVARLPFPDATFDLATSAFLARNLTDLGAVFRELRRVLRPRGTLLTLEVSEPSSPTVARIFHAHFDRAVPLLGRAFAREGPYSYLPESLRSFPSGAGLTGLLAAAGFPRTELCPMSLGIVTAYLSEASSSPDARG